MPIEKREEKRKKKERRKKERESDKMEIVKESKRLFGIRHFFLLCVMLKARLGSDSDVSV